MNISPEVLVVLSTVECNGNRAVLIGQLDRKLYVKTNEVLVALGGKWNSKAKAHLFDGDAAERIDQAIVVGEVTTHKDIGFFPTPPALAAELVRMAKVGPGMVCLEPSAGTGNIVMAMYEAGARVVSVVEQDNKMRRGVASRFADSPFSADRCIGLEPAMDFLKFGDNVIGVKPGGTIAVGSFAWFDRIVMNPPFCGEHLDHARHAYKFLKIGGIEVCVLPSSVLFREDKKHTAFRAWVAEIGGTLSPLPSLSFRPSGTDVNTCVLFVEKRS